MPFGALQLAFFDLYKNGLSFLDTMGVNIFVQRLAWGGAAGGSAVYVEASSATRSPRRAPKTRARSPGEGPPGEE